VSKVQEYDFDIKYINGKKNIVVDMLSRIPTTFSMTNISIDWESILLVEGSVQDERYRVVDDIIYHKYRIYLVPESKLKDKILREHMMHH
jgi:hypothetical protein